MCSKIPEKILGCLKILKYYFRLSKNCVLEILNNVWLLSLKSLRKLHINAISCWHFPLTSCHLVLKTTRRDFPSHGPSEEFFFSKKGNYIWHPQARNKPAAFKKLFLTVLISVKAGVQFSFFLSFPIEFHVENGEGAEEKGFQWRQKGSGARTDTKEFFYFVSPCFLLKKPSKLLKKFEKMGKIRFC